jgi:hypothetical protein
VAAAAAAAGAPDMANNPDLARHQMSTMD